GLFKTAQDIAKVPLKAQNGTPLTIGDIATVVQGPKIRLGQIGKTCKADDFTCGVPPPETKAEREKIIRDNRNKVFDNPDTVEGIVLLQKGENSDTTLEGIH